MKKSRFACSISGLALAALASGHAFAQAAPNIPQPPVRSAVDSDGVNRASGGLSITDQPVSIGDEANGISVGRFWTGAAWWHQWAANIVISERNPDASVKSVTVAIGSTARKFNLVNGAFVNDQGSEETLVQNGSVYVFTLRDGTSVTYEGNLPGIYFTGLSIAVGKAVKKPNGQTYYLTYRAASDGTFSVMRLQSVYNTSGFQAKFDYQTNTLIANTSDQWINVVKVTAFNRATDVCDPTADICSFSQTWPNLQYSSGTNGTASTTTTTDANGNATRYSIANGQLVAIKRPSQTTDDVTAVYNNVPYTIPWVTSITRSGVGTRNYAWTYDTTLPDLNLTSTRSDSLGTIDTVNASSKFGTVNYVTDGDNQTTSFIYDAQKRMASVAYPEGNSVLYTYDSRGNITQATRVAKSGSGLANLVKTAGYDATCANTLTCNLPNWTRDELNNQTDLTYDPTHGGVLTVTAPADGAGIRPQTRYGYTSMQGYFKNSTGSITASGVSQYNLATESTCLTGASCAGTAQERKTTHTYGPQSAGVANNLLEVSNTAAAGDNSISLTTTNGYDNIGNLMTQDGPLAGSADTTRTRYDTTRRVIGSIDPDPDGAGTGRSMLAKRYTYNSDDQVTQTELGTVADQSDSAWTAFSSAQQQVSSYDIVGREVSSKVKSGTTEYQTAQTSYDARGRVSCEVTRMDPAQWSSQADPCVPQTTSANGADRVTKTAYDNADQVTTISRAVGTANEKVVETRTYTANGKPATVKDGDSNLTTYEYDGHDRLLKTRLPSPTQGAAASSTTDYEQLTYDGKSRITTRRLRDGNTIALSYDNLDRVATRTPTGENAVNFTYNLQGQPTSIARPGDGVNLANTYDPLGRQTSEAQPFGAVSYSYDNGGRRNRITWSDGVYASYDYDTAGYLTAVRENGATSGIGVLATYGYDSLGHRTSITRGNGTTSTIAFDPVGRLASLSHNPTGTTSDVSTAYAYNPANQLTQAVRSNDTYAWTGNVNADRPYVTNGLNQYSSASTTNFTYDGRGNLVSSGANAYSYTKLNELKTAPGVTMYYDPAGRMVEYDTSASTRFVYAGDQLVAEVTNPTGAILRRYVPGAGSDEPIVWYEGAGLTDRRWLHADERGSVVAVTDGGGNAIAINRYDEFGIPQAGNVGRFQYTGQIWLPELGMYNYKARIYSPTMGRFLQTDPIGYGDGMNWYNYVHSDPINGTDPTGMDANEIVVIGPSFTMNPNAAFSGSGTAGGGNPSGNPGLSAVTIGFAAQAGAVNAASSSKKNEMTRTQKIARVRELLHMLQGCQVNCKAIADEYFKLRGELKDLDQFDEKGIVYDLGNIVLNSVGGAGNGVRVIFGIGGFLLGSYPKPGI